MSSPKIKRKFDIALFGATGFTGRLTAQYLTSNYPQLKLALVGRDISKLNAIKTSLSSSSESVSVSLLEITDIQNEQLMDSVCKQTKVVLSTAGPFAKIGSFLVDSCVRCGTHYCDITGEPNFVKEMAIKHHETAKEKKIKIVNCCGYDSIPSDLGVYMLVNEMKLQSIEPVEVRMLVGKTKGLASGGTIASGLNIIESSTFSELISLGNPYYLCPQVNILAAGEYIPHITVKANNDKNFPGYDRVYKKYFAPFFMQGVNTRIVHRSNYLKNFAYGKDFLYSEVMATPNFIVAGLVSLALALGGLLAVLPFTRTILKMVLPKPGSGPSMENCRSGCFHMKYWGKGYKINNNNNNNNKKSDGSSIVYGVCDAPGGDPGYIQTSKMLSECGLCLLTQFQPSAATKHKSSITETDHKHSVTFLDDYGVITPSVAFGQQLIERLNVAGITFSIVESK